VAVVVPGNGQNFAVGMLVSPFADAGRGFGGVRRMKEVAENDQAPGGILFQQSGEPGEVFGGSTRRCPMMRGPQQGVFSEMDVGHKNGVLPHQSPGGGGEGVFVGEGQRQFIH